MASSDLHYFILTQPVNALLARKPGQICCVQSFKLRKQGKRVDVVFLDSVTGVDYPVDKESLRPVSPEEVGLLMAIPEEDRLTALDQGLRSARRLREGTEVWVQEGSALLKGTIRYIGNITEPRHKRDIPGVFYGVELQGSDRGRGRSDGSHKFKRLFSCDKDCGVFAPFNRLTAVGPQTSPDPGPGLSSKSRPDLGPESRPESRPGTHPDLDQPMSFLSNHFHQDPPQREAWDSGPRSLSADPEPMDQDHVYEDPDRHRESPKGLSRFKSKSAKLGHVSESKTDGKDRPKFRLDLRPGSAKRAAPPSPESKPKTREVDLPKSPSKPPKIRLATHRSRPDFGLRLRSQSESEGPRPGPADGLQTGDRVMYIVDKDQTVTGTFLFMEETDGGTMANITGDSGMSLLVPLMGLVKLEPEAEDTSANPKEAPGSGFKDSRTECSRPKSEEPDHVKIWSEVVKTRPQSEAEPKAISRTGPESWPDSAEGPTPGLSDGLAAGDQVLFFENQQIFRGTVVFMEDTDDGTMVHIAGDFGTATVPLRSVDKMEPKTNTEDLYTAPPVEHREDSTAPPVERREDCRSLGLDSVVEIDLANGVKGFGTVRWVGFLPGVQHKMAGLELEEQRGVSDGTFRGQRFFWCPDKHALFVKLSSCRPDSRFCRASANHSAQHTGGSANQSVRNVKLSSNHTGPRARHDHNGLTSHQNGTGEFDLEPVPPVATEEVQRVLIGRMKGIQGHHNSCYMDSALFSLFSVSSVLDSLLFKSTSPRDAEVQRILLRDIVNPLRRDGFVEGRHVMNLRKQLQKHGFSQSFTTDEKDPEEFLTVIMQHILNLDPLLKLCSGGKVQDAFCFQIFLDQNQDLLLPSVQQLLEHSFHSNALKLSEVPSCLILQMPRFGKKFKMFDRILPSLELDVTDLLQHSSKQCVLCGAEALWECPDCFLDPAFGSNGLKLFCEQCSRQVHAHTRRHGHHPAPLEIRHRSHRERFHGNRDKLHLLAVLCIETSHYVSFVKYGPDPQHWLFFDSMADREGEADGFNVPQVTLAPELSQYLTMSLSELANQAPRDMRGVAKRLLCDAYLYLYQNPALHLYT